MTDSEPFIHDRQKKEGVPDCLPVFQENDFFPAEYHDEEDMILIF